MVFSLSSCSFFQIEASKALVFWQLFPYYHISSLFSSWYHTGELYLQNPVREDRGLPQLSLVCLSSFTPVWKNIFPKYCTWVVSSKRRSILLQRTCLFLSRGFSLRQDGTQDKQGWWGWVMKSWFWENRREGVSIVFRTVGVIMIKILCVCVSLSYKYTLFCTLLY